MPSLRDTQQHARYYGALAEDIHHRYLQGGEEAGAALATFDLSDSSLMEDTTGRAVGRRCQD